MEHVTSKIQDELSRNRVAEILRVVDADIGMRIGKILSRLSDDRSDGYQPILERFESPTGSRIYRFRDQRYLMCLRTIFQFTRSGREITVRSI